MEDGEISEPAAANHAPGYDPAYEWPGTEDPSTSDAPQPSHALTSNSRDRPTLRLIVEKSSILSPKRRLAILEGYTEIQIGRDLAPPGSETPRVRLKEMEISKLHATIFWDTDRLEWAIVDMGSKHGTFVASSGGEGRGAPTGPVMRDERGIRLSVPRTASVPRRLRHMDRLTLGSTTFVVHVHEERLPCVECSASAQTPGDEIPLFDARQKESAAAGSAQKRKHEPDEVEDKRTVGMGRDAKKALTSLKRDLLNRHSSSPGPSSGQSTPGYVDRSARRRALHSSSAPDMPGMPPIMPPPIPSRQKPVPMPVPPPRPPSPPRSAPPMPLNVTNVGHKLLMKQGWEPGTALGLPETEPDSESRRLIEPLEVNSTSHRAGLGMQSKDKDTKVPNTPAGPAMSWTQRRWSDLQRGGS
ncbi:hypothetical protein DENSPDRAFT_832516 [Dentipellis sp. KUC8613]|nr:hypothetical protein DENSPDRAFT_832516 [Dentipellis sp. KUC8613]